MYTYMLCFQQNKKPFWNTLLNKSENFLSLYESKFHRQYDGKKFVNSFFYIYNLCHTVKSDVAERTCFTNNNKISIVFGCCK
jgi:hypothetical protein